MATTTHRGTRRLRVAAALVLVGLAIQGVSLLWLGPSSFLVFILAGAVMTVAGIVVAAVAVAAKSQ